MGGHTKQYAKQGSGRDGEMKIYEHNLPNGGSIHTGKPMSRLQTEKIKRVINRRAKDLKRDMERAALNDKS